MHQPQHLPKKRRVWLRGMGTHGVIMHLEHEGWLDLTFTLKKQHAFFTSRTMIEQSWSMNVKRCLLPRKTERSQDINLDVQGISRKTGYKDLLYYTHPVWESSLKCNMLLGTSSEGIGKTWSNHGRNPRLQPSPWGKLPYQKPLQPSAMNLVAVGEVESAFDFGKAGWENIIWNSI